MRFAIQRRGLYLTPPERLDLTWLFRKLDSPEISANFGFERGVSTRAQRTYRTGGMIAGIMRRVSGRERIGFCTLLAPSPANDFWEYAAAVPEPLDRDAYTMIHGVDAMAHYVLDHVGLPMYGSRIRDDNGASLALVRRIGFRQTDHRVVGGVPYSFFTLDREQWEVRKAKLARGEAAKPSGIGGVFVKLDGPPWVPIEVPTSGA